MFATHGTSIDTLTAIVNEIKQLRKEEPKSEEFVLVKDLAEILDLDRSSARKYVLRLGIKPHRRRTPSTQHQSALAVTKEEAKKIINVREAQGSIKVSADIIDPEIGLFYIVQLVPELNKKRIKLGFTDDLKRRLAQHRIVAPTAIILKSWPCKRVWKLPVIDSIVSVKCKDLSNEVFECDSIKALLRRGDKFFALLPKIYLVVEDKHE